ncbi:hypothetical protein CR152_00325 [Massilia violaceinigra]|uniref:Pesticin C-terminal domain-containing protein n=1 Tax=Massilia violaceinigra TaxID=2045208 RepID=A0A2D2DDR4_9BURK|nr:pesticin C-terminus-like muramidase [Massilia violaceinigra]ATQ73124.1 hypothetical protein CR152_00325 [Massilia violaceinigra]
MSKKKQSSSLSKRVSLVEENLPDYDKEELQKERDLIALSEECKASEEIAKREIQRLNKEKKILSKKEQNYKEKVRNIEQKIVHLQGIPDATCRVRHPGCVEVTNAKKIKFPKSIGDEINKRHGTKIDFSKLVELEGGEHTAAYIPWWAYVENDKPVIRFYPGIREPDVPRLAGGYGGRPDNKSGTTVGVGVDLGQFSPDAFLRMMKKGNGGAHQITDEELSALHEKIIPYFQLIGGDACRFLRKNPLILNERQTNFLDKISQDEALEKTISLYQYRIKNTKHTDFVDLTVEQQTALLSHTYQYGTPTNDLLNAIWQGKRSLIPSIREREYLYKSMPAEKNKE